MSELDTTTLNSLRKMFTYYKSLGEKAIEQVNDEQLFWQPSPEGNSIAILVKHLWGNMRSRFTDFLTSDGEKENRHRDTEFEIEMAHRMIILEYWEKGWKIFFDALDGLEAADLSRTIYIRNEGHQVIEALHRQLGHYAYHIGQMVLLAKTVAGDDWTSLSIPKGKSEMFNKGKFSQEKSNKHFSDEK
ncbi:MAG TPA: DUF1572 domain-containing protein [Bacteroidetes bacterium]|nr:DUF1572 domain-containing protein [Bacteroidota bacterium]